MPRWWIIFIYFSSLFDLVSAHHQACVSVTLCACIWRSPKITCQSNSMVWAQCGTMMAPYLDFLFNSFWHSGCFFFFLLNLSVGHRCGQLSLKRIHTYMISNCSWEIVKPLYHNANQINHCYFDIYCLCKINLFVSWKIDVFFLFHVW